MSETFVPLVSATAASRESAFASLNLKAASSAAKPGPEARPAATVPCAKPTVTLQRTGDIVSSIRVQCGCGQVIELACVY